MRTRDQVLSMGTAQMISTGLGIIYSIVTARGLGPALRGQLYVAQAYFTTASMLLSLSLATVMTVQVSRGDFETAEVHTSAVLMSALLGMGGGILALVLYVHTTRFSGPAPWVLVVFFLSLPAVLYKALWGGIVLGLRRIGLLSLYAILDAFLTALGAGLALYVFRLGLPGILIMLAIESGVMAVIGYAVFAKMGHDSWHLSLRCMRNLCGQGSQQQLAATLQQLYLRADAFILPHFLSPLALGEYAIARGISDRTTVAFTPIAQVMFPHISSRDSRTARHYTRLTFRQLAGLGVAITAALVIVMPKFIPLMYGSAYRDAVLLADILCIALIVRSITVPIELWFVGGLLKPGLTAISSAFMLVAVSASGYFLTRRFAGIGMASAVLSSFVLSLGFTIWLANRKGLGLRKLLPSIADLRLIFAIARQPSGT
ncbi:MAG: oligosaccharide flippase family protein [Terracidiphilus sp.]|jgi:O-antigen/teichoic acid export membrane protein